MPRRCCVPLCKSNYDSEKTSCSTFKFPEDASRREKWLKCINRKDFVPGAQAAVCINHFEESFIIRQEKFKLSDGSEAVVDRKKITLTKDAFPTIFPNQPHYMSKKVPTKRTCPDARRESMQQRDEESFKKWMKDDIIHSFQELQKEIKDRLPATWFIHEDSKCITIFQANFEGVPTISINCKILDNLTVAAYKGELNITNTLNFILEKEQKLDKWTKFDNVISFLSSFDESNISFEKNIEIAVDLLKKASATVDDEAVAHKLDFLLEQLLLVTMKQKRYSADMLFWSTKFYYSYPAAYILLRESAVITVPNVSYLRKLSTSLSFQPGENYLNQHVSYLKKKCSLLDEHEKTVNILLDEIYITPTISYKGGNIVGVSDNTASEASTVQTFMLASLYSKNKDVICNTCKKFESRTTTFIYIKCNADFERVWIHSANLVI